MPPPMPPPARQSNPSSPCRIDEYHSIGRSFSVMAGLDPPREHARPSAWHSRCPVKLAGFSDAEAGVSGWRVRCVTRPSARALGCPKRANMVQGARPSVRTAQARPVYLFGLRVNRVTCHPSALGGNGLHAGGALTKAGAEARNQLTSVRRCNLAAL